MAQRVVNGPSSPPDGTLWRAAEAARKEASCHSPKQPRCFDSVSPMTYTNPAATPVTSLLLARPVREDCQDPTTMPMIKTRRKDAIRKL
jgi:hypothetical protein